MMRIRTVFPGLALLAAGMLSAADFQTDFSASPIAGMKIVRRATVTDGVLKVQNGGNVVFDQKADKPFRIAFRVRVNQFLESRTPPYFSLVLHGVDSYQGRFMFRGDNIIEHYLFKNNKRRQGFGGISRYSVTPGEWLQLELTVMKSFVQLSCDGKVISTAKYEGLIPLESVSFGTYNTVWEMDDLSFSIIREEAPKTEEKPVFSIDFDRNLEGQDPAGAAVKPVRASGVVLEPGVEGKALKLSAGKGELVFDLQQPLDSRVGGLMFWVKARRGGRFFQLADRNRVVLSAFGGNGQYRLQVARKQSDKPLEYIRTAPGTGGDWVLIALSWNPDHIAQYYINMIPYVVSFTPMQRVPEFLDADLDGIRQLRFASDSREGCAIDRLRLFRRPLTNQDVYREYRQFMPIDMVMKSQIVPAGSPVKLAVQGAPAGGFTRPLPVPETEEKTTAQPVSLSFQLTDMRGNTLLNSQKERKIESLQEIELEPVTLAAGKYLLRCTVNGGYSRSWPLTALPPQSIQEESDSPLPVGKSVFCREFSDPAAEGIWKQGPLTRSDDGKYLEMGAGKNDRMSIEITFPRSVLGKPVALDITWPDDKTRTMGWYMYPCGIPSNRDRLQSGVSAGSEFPNSGRLVTTRHIFYPGVEKYLFECRTLAADMPAAISKIEVFELPSGLPSLKVRSPRNIPGRAFGFYDEDQTFTNNLNADAIHPKSPVYQEMFQKSFGSIPFYTEELIRYFRYTGMNTAHLPLWRYSFSYFPLEGQTESMLYPGMGTGTVDYVINSLRANGIRLIANMNYKNLPDIATSYGRVDRDFRREGLEMLDRYGDSINRYLSGERRGNIAHPEYFRLFSTYFEWPLQCYAKNPGFGGISFMMSPIATWDSLEYGYDDWTVNRFSRETGIPVPEKLRERYSYLTGEKRSEWLKWRSEQVTSFVRKLRELLDRYNPELKLYLSIPQDTGKKNTADPQAAQNQQEPVSGNYENYGIDIDQLKTVPRVSFTLSRHPTARRHDFFWGKPESDYYETLYIQGDEESRRYLTDGAAGAVLSGHTYFETFVKPLSKNYSCYFENADIKPHGRWYLRELAFAVGAFDALEYIAGGQPLNTIGREEESREFARAFRALPARPFRQIPGVSDPVVARALPTPEGTYFYAVNLFHEEAVIEIDLPEAVPYQDLSTGRESGDSRIRLRPFQLRSFLIPGREIVPRSVRLVSVAPRAGEFYRERLRTLEEIARLLEKGGLNTAPEQRTIERMRRELQAGHYAELYRLAFSRQMNQLMLKQKNLSYFLRKQQQTARGNYAVNCGSFLFYDAPGGKLFFPDQKFDGEYGYEGRYSSITRDITGLKETEFPELFKTEAYNLEQYRFRVPDGRYTVVLYMKPGFQPNFEPGSYIFTLRINGKPVLAKYDLHRVTGGDFHRPVRVEFPDIEVTGGNLLLTWNHEQKRLTPGSTTICLANAIEVIRQPK